MSPQLDNNLIELETAIRTLLERNQTLQARNRELEQALHVAREDNDTLQLGLMEQEEAGASTRQRVESLLALLATQSLDAPAVSAPVAVE